MPTPQAAVLTDDRSIRRDSPTAALAHSLFRQTQEPCPVKAHVSIPSDKRDTLILAAVRASSTTHTHATAHRRALQAHARHLTGFEHFRRLALSDLREAFHHDRLNTTRTAKNHRRTWLALFRHYAQRQGIKQVLKITALDRQGNYTCTLTDPASGKDPWIKLVHLAREFGITEKALTALWHSQQSRPHSVAPKPATRPGSRHHIA